MTRSLATIIAALILGLAGCGGGDEVDDSERSGEEPQTEQTPAGGAEPAKPGNQEDNAGSGGGDDGKQLFAGTCGSCHTLSDAGTNGTFGPNLDELKPDKARVLNAIKTGPGAMPDNLFEGAKAESVADYVSGAAGK